MGVLIKNAEALERMEKVDTVIVDKTGTLTEGKPAVVAIEVVAGPASFSTSEVLRLAAAVENASEHPLARAIVDKAQAELSDSADSAKLPEVADFDAPAGKGVLGTVQATGSHRHRRVPHVPRHRSRRPGRDRRSAATHRRDRRARRR